MVDINNVSLSGCLHTDPKEIMQDSKDKKATFIIAVSSFNGQGQGLKNDYFNVEAKGAKAKQILQYANKGDSISLSGRLKTLMYVENETQITKSIVYIRLQDCRIFPKTARQSDY